MKRKLIFSGMILLALVLTTGTFAYTYNGFAATTLDAVIADAVMTTYEPSDNQPDWNEILPEGEYDSEFLLPNGIGDETRLTPSDPTSLNWEMVDDMPPDDAETYVYTTGRKYTRDLYNLRDHIYADGSETIMDITVYFRFGGAGGTVYAKPAIKTHGAVFEGDEESLPDGAIDTKSYQWEANPATHQPWTWDDIDELQAGVNLKGQNKNTTAGCTQVYVAVNYEFRITQGAVPDGELYHVTPHHDYTGDMLIKVYLTNTGDLLKALQYINMKIYVENSLEANKTPDYQILSIETGVVLFSIEGGSAESYTVEVVGGSYRLVSGYTEEWREGWSVTPEFYLEVTQR